jgi:hypothetical protein
MRLDRRAHPCATGADDEHVVLRIHFDARYRTVCDMRRGRRRAGVGFD